ncbi:TSUP family transporter [Allosphingosinicella vermicomposti]|uniref:TSUP family transporter n=1 Tax=Allosphingosinicella vermicomposti TaxID=614671 RepID=UPI000D0ED4BF|nr:TSUP family transporter [Allosphingosinicella vermicomposti]
MEFGFDTFLLLIAAAGAAGFIDAIAGGGGLLTVPALLTAGIPPVAALGTNKLQSSFGTAFACFRFYRAGLIDARASLVPILFVLVGAAGGALTVQAVDPAFLAAILPVLLVGIAAYFLLSPKMTDEDKVRRLGPLGFGFAAGCVGFYDGFFGPGAGSFYTLCFVTLAGFGLLKATAHTKLLNFTSNIVALAVLAAGGKVLWLTGLSMAAANMVGAHFGTGMAMRFGARVIRPLLAAMSVALTVKMVSDPANPIAQLIWAG